MKRLRTPGVNCGNGIRTELDVAVTIIVLEVLRNCIISSFHETTTAFLSFQSPK